MIRLKACFIFLMLTTLTGTVLQAEEQNNMNLTALAATYIPIGEFRTFSILGAGVGAAIDLDLFPPGSSLSRVKPKAELAAIFNIPAQEKFAGLIDLHWNAGGAYILPLGEKLAAGGGIYYGGIIHFLLFDSLVQGTVTKLFYDQAVNLQGEIFITLPGFQLAVHPGYQFFFEKDYLGQQVYLKAGVRFSL